MLFLKQYRKRIDTCLLGYLKEKKAQSTFIWEVDLLDRLLAFSQDGKRLRGSLFLYGLELFGQEVDESAVKIACAVELIHACLLIYDDIIDEDAVRRGQTTLYKQYAQAAPQGENDNYGKGMAQCAGLYASLLATDLLSQTTYDAQDINTTLSYISQEIRSVTIGEMHDLHLSALEGEVDERAILEVHKRKTARYTFVLPLVLAAHLTQQSSQTIKDLEVYGEHLGIVFQIRDDELDIFGEESEFGKPVGSDIVEYKKTLFTCLLFARVSSQEKEKLLTIFGHPITPENLAYVKECLVTHKVVEDVAKKVDAFVQASKQALDNLDLSTQQKEDLYSFITYNLERKK